MLVEFHKGFVMEGENTATKRKYLWSKPESVRRKIYCTTGIYGICDDSELAAEVERQIKAMLASDGWGKEFSGWQRILSYEESLELAEHENWGKFYSSYSPPKCELITKTLDKWTVERAAKELNGKQFAQYCRDYGIAIKEDALNV